MASSTKIKFYSKSFGESGALSKSTEEAGSIIFDKTSESIYVGGVKYGSNVKNATFSSNKLIITRISGDSIELDFSTLATTSSVMEAFNEIKGLLTMDQSAGEYVAQGDESYVSSNTLTNVNTTNVIDITGSDTDMVDGAVAKVDRKAKSILGEVIVAKKEINAIETGAGLSENGSYTANTNTNYIKEATSLKDADVKLDAAIKDVSDIVDGLTSGTVSDVTVNDKSVKTEEGVANILVEGTYNNDNKIATQTTVSNAIDALKNNLTGNATIASKSGNTVTLKIGVTESNGVISNNDGADITLADVASTGAAADVTIANDKITATNVEGALTELATSIENNVIKISSGEKVISKSEGNELSTTLKMVVEKQGETGNQKDYIVLKGINGVEITKVDASQFLKDGMLSNAELVTAKEEGVTEEVPYIKLSFNTDAGQQDIRFSVSSLVDTYTSGNSTALTVDNYTITPNTGEVAENAGTLTTGGQVYTAITNTKGQDIQIITGEEATTQGNYINVKVTATKGTSDNNYTLLTTSNVTTHAVSTASENNDGLATALDVKNYVVGQVGTAVQSVDGSVTEKKKEVTQSDYATVKVSATNTNNNITLDSAVALTIQSVSSADATHMGLAEANDVKTYVDAHKASVKNNGATIPVNDSNATTLATVDGTAITANVSFTWEEFN